MFVCKRDEVVQNCGYVRINNRLFYLRIVDLVMKFDYVDPSHWVL